MNRILGMVALANIALAMVGCGNDGTTATPDGGGTDMAMNGDGGTPDMPRTDSGRDMTVATTLPTCAAPEMVTGVLDETSTVMVDTTGGPAGPLTLTECGAQMDQVAPQAVVAFVVPGTGDVTIDFTTDTEGTSAEIDTVVEVIDGGACTDEPATGAGCFDDIEYPGNVLSGGSIVGIGGSTIYFVLTGYGDDAGAIQFDIHPYVNAAPTMSAATFNIGTIRSLVRVTGMDSNGNADHFTARLMNSESGTLDVNDDGMVDAMDTLELNFQNDIVGMTSFTGEVSFTGGALATLRELNPATVEITLLDSAGAASTPMTIPVTMNDDGVGATCSETAPCGNLSEIACVGGTCTVDATVAAACGTTMSIAIATPAAGGASATSVTGTTGGPPAAALGGTCQPSHLAPTLYTVTVPEGAYDLIAHTDVEGTDEMADTIVSIRSTCADYRTEVACNDDTEGSTRSEAVVQNVAAGTYTILVDQWVGATPPTAGLAFGMEVRLRSVVAVGAACDPTGVMNRCAEGACPAEGTAVCPAASTTDGGIDADAGVPDEDAGTS